MTTKKNAKGKPEETPSANPPTAPREGPYVFVSHDARDADLAEAFANLLTDASGGMLKSFRSSDRKGSGGIEFGMEWYKAIMSGLSKATDVVALLTHHSVDRPWILYEAGVAKGKLDTTVLGVAVGIPLDKANTGPFAQFQNSGDDEDSLTDLVLQLIRKIPNASPREEAVRRQVRAFRESISSLLKSRGKLAEPSPKIDDATIAKMFEEVKLLVRDLPERMQTEAHASQNPRRRRPFRGIPPEAFLDEITHRFEFRRHGTEGVPLLLLLGFIRDDFPWLYELGLEFYRALQRGDEKDIEKAHHALRAATEMSGHPMMFEFMGGPEREESFMLLRHVMHALDRLLHRSLPPRKRAKQDTEEQTEKQLE
jgi:hypothetical protein